MTIRIPTKESLDVQNAFRDCEARLRVLEANPVVNSAEIQNLKSVLAALQGVSGAILEHRNLLSGSLLSNDHPLYQRKHGFEVSSAGAALQTISYDKTTRKVTVTPVGTSFRFWIDGVQFVKNVAEVSVAHATTTGKYFIYYDATGVLQTSAVETPWSVRDRTVTPVSLVYWSNTLSDGVCFFECHTADRTLEQHYHDHFSQGTRFISGYDLTGYTIVTDTDAAVTYAIGAGVCADEDIKFDSGAKADGGPYSIFYRSGASGEWVWTATDTFPFKYGTTYPSYNNINAGGAGVWGLTEVAGGGSIQYINYFVCATTAVTPVAASAFHIPGQAIFSTSVGAQQESFASLSLGILPFEEVAPLYRVTLAIRNSYGGTHKVWIETITSLKGQTVSVSGGVGITDHGALSGLADNDHPQYVLDAGDTMTGSLAINADFLTQTSPASFAPQHLLTNTNADTSAPYIIFQKLSASPAAGDAIGTVLFQGKDSGGNTESFASISSEAENVTNGTEIGRIVLSAALNGSMANPASVAAGAPNNYTPQSSGYFRPVAFARRSTGSAAGTILNNRWNWDVGDVDTASGSYSVSGGKVIVTNAGFYRFSFDILTNIAATTGPLTYVMLFNSSNTLLSYNVASAFYNAAGTSKDYHQCFSQSISMAAGDYIVIESQATYAGDSNWNRMSIERLN